MSPLRILWVAPNFPWPTTNGGKTRQNALLRKLALRGHRITFLGMSKTVPTEAALAEAAKFLEKILVLPRRPRTSAHTIVRSAFSFTRPTVATINGYSAAFENAFEQLLQENFDIVQIEHSYTFESLDKPLRGSRIPFLLTEHNLESEVVELQYTRLGGVFRLLGKLDVMRARLWEGTVINRASCVIAATETERQAFEKMGASRTALVPNSVETSTFSAVRRDPMSRRLLFIGNYEYPSNVNAVKWLCDEIMPRLWSICPDAKLTICGFAMPKRWRKRWPDPRMAFDGYVTSVAQTHGSSSVFIAPLLQGAGSKLKVIEAMASGLPVIATDNGISGLRVADRTHYRHGSDAAQIALVAAELLHDHDQADRLGLAARAYVAQHHDWAAAATELEGVYFRHLEHVLGHA
jgi:polysaccharide biosynthesis protein PslH